MNEFQATTVMMGLFALRCVVPLLVILALGRLMNRLVERWNAEEERALQRGGAARPSPALPTSAPAAHVRRPAMSLPCWLLRNCDEQQRERCPAYRRQGIPCWQARLIEGGTLPASCATCPQYMGMQAA